MVKELKVDTEYFLLHHMDLLSKDTGGICVCGFITTIAKKLNYAVESLDKAKGSLRISLETCRSMNMIATEGDINYLVLKEDDVKIPLPDVDRTTVQIKTNWKMPFDPSA
ncbi:hypothetical protein Droror1_Dr00027649, partial [Drosera rotundifolia]